MTYKIEGTGSSTAEADRNLSGKLDEVTAKLTGGGVSTDFRVQRSIYVGEFTLKDGLDPTKAKLTRFRAESDQGWKEIIKKAGVGKAAGNYNATFTRQEFLALTSEQESAVAGKGHRPPAGPIDGGSYVPARESALTRFLDAR